MTSTTAGAPVAAPRDLRNARIAVAALFFTNGAIFANLLPRYPEIKRDLALSNAEYGLAIASFPLGALIAGLAAAALIRRYRSSRVAVVGTLFVAGGVFLAGASPTWITLAAALFFAGAMDAITDVAQNSHGLRVQRLYGRSILNSFHAVWSIGAVSGGLLGGLAVALDVPRGIHLAVTGALFFVVVLISYRFLLPGAEPAERGVPVTVQADDPRTHGLNGGGPRARRTSPYPTLAALVVIAVGGTLVEDAGSTWAAVYLSGQLDASVSIAALGFVAMVGAQFVGRLLGDGLVDRFGQRAVARAGGVIVFLGMGAALAFPSVAGTIIGFGLAGFGVATLVPAAMHGADELHGLRPGTGLTVISWLMRVGFLVSPPVVGLIADTFSLRLGLLVVPFAAVLVIVLAGVLSSERAKQHRR
ncbi:MFS transporter [uncultured Arthrobacter sp.]|uniref:MFS transporter n=1 Tax=uncultured Arthrobacter sp. TaxID=114050 RepID=UPI002607DD9C|nr:MFS transporter [uncultured Arthrobacter sp.]